MKAKAGALTTKSSFYHDSTRILKPLQSTLFMVTIPLGQFILPRSTQYAVRGTQHRKMAGKVEIISTFWCVLRASMNQTMEIHSFNSVRAAFCMLRGAWKYELALEVMLSKALKSMRYNIVKLNQFFIPM